MSCGLDPNKQHAADGCPACSGGPRITLALVLKLVGGLTVAFLILDNLSR